MALAPNAERSREYCVDELRSIADRFASIETYNPKAIKRLAKEATDVLDEAYNSGIVEGSPLDDLIREAWEHEQEIHTQPKFDEDFVRLENDEESLLYQHAFRQLFGYLDADVDRGCFDARPGTLSQLFPSSFFDVVVDFSDTLLGQEWWDEVRPIYRKACKLLAGMIEDTQPQPQEHSDAVLDATELQVQPTNEARDQADSEAAQVVEITEAKVKEFRGYLNKTWGENTSEHKWDMAELFSNEWKHGNQPEHPSLIARFVKENKKIPSGQREEMRKRYEKTMHAMIGKAKSMGVEDYQKLFIYAVS